MPAAIGVALCSALLAAAVTWLLRGRRYQREKAALNSGWQRQIDAQRTEQQRSAERNDKLKVKLNEVQAAARMQKQRLQSLDDELRAAKGRRDELQRDIQQIRNNLEDALRQRATEVTANIAAVADPEADAVLAEKDRKIRRLKRELQRWQERVPPLVQRYRERDAAANELAALHAAAVARLAELETHASIDGTRLEPLEEDSIRHLAASNDQYDDTLAVCGSAVRERAADRHGIDDLKRIKGIGPAIEKTLNRLGIYRFDQLAALSPAEVNRVAGELRGFHSRIEREDWVGQAGLLMEAHDNA